MVALGRRNRVVHGAARLHHRQYRNSFDGGESRRGTARLKAVVTSYILSLAVGIPVSGWIADRYGTRRVFAVAVGIFTFASVLCGLSASVPMLIALRAFCRGLERP